MCHISSACHAYIMWAELGHCHFLKWNHALGFEFSIQSSLYGATTVMMSTWTRSTVSFYSM